MGPLAPLEKVIDPTLCEWDTALFLIFSENVFGNYIYYSHLFPTLVGLVLGIFVLWQQPRALINRVLFFLFLSFSLWNYIDLILWATEKTHYTMFFWSILIFFDLLIYASTLYFVHLFIDDRDVSITKKIIVGGTFLPLIFLVHTPFNLVGFDFTNCDREALEGVLWHYTYFVELFFACWILVYAMERYKFYKDSIKRRQITYVTAGSLLFLLAFSWGNITGSLAIDWEIGQYGILGAVVFVAFLAHLIIRYHVFNAKLLATQALVVALALSELSILLAHSLENVRIITIATFILTVFLGTLLVQSVRREIKQRERIELLAVELEKANVRLKQLDKMKTEFVSIASHQLRAPLAAIKGYASMLLEDAFGKITLGTREAVGKIFTSSALMARSVDDFLNVSRIELGQMKYDLSDFNFCDLIKTVISEQEPIAKEKGITLSFEKDPQVNTCDVFADMGKIKQVLTNLVDNAIKYTPKGTVAVTFTRDVKRELAIVEIADTGIGMSQETIKKLFDKFVRAHNANKVNVIGTGLGLYVVKQFVEAHGGKIQVLSDGEGKGSRFVVKLPFRAPDSLRRNETTPTSKKV
jgi:signal transduction histidine kinase